MEFDLTQHDTDHEMRRGHDSCESDTLSLEDGQSDVTVEDVVEEPPRPPAVMSEMRGARAAFRFRDDVELETTFAQRTFLMRSVPRFQQGHFATP